MNLLRARREKTQSYFSLCFLFTGCREIAVGRSHVRSGGRLRGGTVGRDLTSCLGVSTRYAQRIQTTKTRLYENFKTRGSRPVNASWTNISARTVNPFTIQLFFRRKAITSDCFFVSQVCGLFRFTQRLITKPIPPICGVVVSADKPINWMHTSA